MKKLHIFFIIFLIAFGLNCKKEPENIDYNKAVATLIDYCFRDALFSAPLNPLQPPEVFDSIVFNMKHKIILNDNFSDTISNLNYGPLKDWTQKQNKDAKCIKVLDKIRIDTLRNIQIKLMKVDTTIFKGKLDHLRHDYNVDGIFTVSNPFYYKHNGEQYFAFYSMFIVDGLTIYELAILLKYHNGQFKVIKTENFLRNIVS